MQRRPILISEDLPFCGEYIAELDHCQCHGRIAINPANCGLMAQDYQIRVPLEEPSTIPECAPMIHQCNILSQPQLTTIMTSLIFISSAIYFALSALFSVISLKEPIYRLPEEAVTL